MLKYMVLSLLLLVSPICYAQTNSEKRNLEAAFHSLNQSSRKVAQFELQNANLYYQTVDGVWGNGTESALLAAYSTLINYDIDVSLRTVESARSFLNFIITGSAQKFLFGEAHECDGCDHLQTNDTHIATHQPQSAEGFVSNRQNWSDLFSNEGSTLKHGIELMGVHWGMPDQDILQELENRGFPCRRGETSSGTKKIEAIICGGEAQKNIMLANEIISFGCGVFGVCQATPREVAERLVFQGIIHYIEPLDTNIIVTGEYWCGTGVFSDRLCILPNLFDGTGAIEIERHQFGSAASFN